MAKPTRSYGLLAEFDTSAALYPACERVRDAGYVCWDAHTPFPVHGLDRAMGMKRSIVPYIVFVMGMTGASLGMLLQWWTSAIDYPVVISAKPYFSWQAFIPVTFELGILLGSFGAVFGMLGVNKLPQYYHSLFNADRFARVTDDKFFIAIEARDPNYDHDGTRQLLEQAGAVHVEEVED